MVGHNFDDVVAALQRDPVEELATALAIGVAKIGSPTRNMIGMWAKLEEFDKERFRKLARHAFDHLNRGGP